MQYFRQQSYTVRFAFLKNDTAHSLETVLEVVRK